MLDCQRPQAKLEQVRQEDLPPVHPPVRAVLSGFFQAPDPLVNASALELEERSMKEDVSVEILAGLCARSLECLFDALVVAQDQQKLQVVGQHS